VLSSLPAGQDIRRFGRIEEGTSTVESHVLPQSLIFAMETRESPSFAFSAFTDHTAVQ
jgi:hypothetical protein